MRCLGVIALCLAAAPAFSQGQSELEHVPPDPPQSRVHAMPYGEMAEMMGMDDRKHFGKVMLDELEWEHSDDGSAFGWDAAAWYGGDFNKIRVESEGIRSAGETHESRAELLWDRIVTPWWSVRAGVRHDAGFGPSRDWAAFGVAGLAPGFIEVEAAIYVGESGRTAVRFSGHYDLMFTQRLVLQPEVELAAYGRNDEAKQIESGLSELKLGLRLRYEFRRELAPYLGVGWTRREDNSEFTCLAGLRAWF